MGARTSPVPGRGAVTSPTCGWGNGSLSLPSGGSGGDDGLHVHGHLPAMPPATHPRVLRYRRARDPSGDALRPLPQALDGEGRARGRVGRGLVREAFAVGDGGMKLGSLCSGIDGLALGLERALGARTVWQSEVDPHADTVLAHHWPAAPNLGDLRAVDWGSVESVDVMCFGFPCQDISSAGRRAGLEGEKSGLWFDCADAVRVLRPRFVFVENVGALLVRGFGTVAGDLAAMGYVGRWGCLRSSDVGAPHRRERVFLAAAYTGGAGAGRYAGTSPRTQERPRRGEPHEGHGSVVGRAAAPYQGPDALGRQGRAKPAVGPVADPDGERFERRPEQDRHTDDGLEPPRRPHADGCGVPVWGPYESAVRRWEAIHGPAPRPRDDRGRLNPELPEWMMGFPPGWVTGLDIPRTAQLRLIGNAVQPQVAALAARLLLAPLLAEEAAA